jgi:trehalose 6-phosphate synthase/phosphatase
MILDLYWTCGELDEHTTLVVLSGSDRSVLDEVIRPLSYDIIDHNTSHHNQHIFYIQNFGEFNMWLAAEHGMFLRPTDGEWMTTMPEHLNMEWIESVKVRQLV